MGRGPKGRRSPDPHLTCVLHNRLQSARPDGADRVAAVARMAGIERERLYRLCEGRLHLWAEELPRLYRATRDLGFYASLAGADELGLVVTKQPEPGVHLRSGVDEAISSMGRAGTMVRLLSDAVSDGRIDHLERPAILKDLSQLMRQLVALQGALGGVRDEEE